MIAFSGIIAAVIGGVLVIGGVTMLVISLLFPSGAGPAVADICVGSATGATRLMVIGELISVAATRSLVRCCSLLGVWRRLLQ
jgi:hypothetical protein